MLCCSFPTSVLIEGEKRRSSSPYRHVSLFRVDVHHEEIFGMDRSMVD